MCVFKLLAFSNTTFLLRQMKTECVNITIRHINFDDTSLIFHNLRKLGKKATLLRSIFLNSIYSQRLALIDVFVPFNYFLSLYVSFEQRKWIKWQPVVWLSMVWLVYQILKFKINWPPTSELLIFILPLNCRNALKTYLLRYFQIHIIYR